MLDFEFYIANATTVLLWLFQDFDHRVLVGLIALGAVFVLVSLCVLAVEIVRILLYFPSFFLSVLFDISRYYIFTFFPEASFRSSQSPQLQSSSLQASNMLDRLALDRDATLARLVSFERRLSLPQSLALNPDQWSELEARSPRSVASDSNSNRIQIANSSVAESRPPLRRSRRLQRVRVCDPCVHSN